MRSIRVFVLAFVAVLSCGAIAATSASALLFLTQLNLELFLVNAKSVSKLTTLTAGTPAIECETTLAHGYALNLTDRVDLLLFTFHKCTLATLGSCQSANEPGGLIKTLDLRGLLVSLKTGTAKNFGIKIEPEMAGKELAEFTCVGGMQKIVVSGSVVGEFTEAESNVGFVETNLKFSLNAAKEAGMPRWPLYETLEGAGTAKLTSVLSGLIAGESESAEEGEGKIKLLHEGKICGK